MNERITSSLKLVAQRLIGSCLNYLGIKVSQEHCNHTHDHIWYH